MQISASFTPNLSECVCTVSAARVLATGVVEEATIKISDEIASVFYYISISSWLFCLSRRCDVDLGSALPVLKMFED